MNHSIPYYTKELNGSHHKKDCLPVVGPDLSQLGLFSLLIVVIRYFYICKNRVSINAVHLIRDTVSFWHCFAATCTQIVFFICMQTELQRL